MPRDEVPDKNLERVNDIDIAEVHQSKTLFDEIESATRPFNSFIKLLYALDCGMQTHPRTRSPPNLLSAERLGKPGNGFRTRVC